MKRLEQILLGVTSCIVYERVSFMFESKKEEYAEIKRLSLNYETQLEILRNKSHKDNLLIDELFSKLQDSKLREDILSNQVTTLENQMSELCEEIEAGDLSGEALSQKLEEFEKLFYKLVEKPPSQLFKDMAWNNSNIQVPFPKPSEIIVEGIPKIMPRYKDGVLLDTPVDILKSSLEFYKYNSIELYILYVDYLCGFSIFDGGNISFFFNGYLF